MNPPFPRVAVTCAPLPNNPPIPLSDNVLSVTVALPSATTRPESPLASTVIRLAWRYPCSMKTPRAWLRTNCESIMCTTDPKTDQVKAVLLVAVDHTSANERVGPASDFDTGLVHVRDRALLDVELHGRHDDDPAVAALTVDGQASQRHLARGSGGDGDAIAGEYADPGIDARRRDDRHGLPDRHGAVATGIEHDDFAIRIRSRQ